MNMPEFKVGQRVWVYSGPDSESESYTKGIPFAGQGIIVGTVEPGAGEHAHHGGYLVHLDVDESAFLEDGREFIWAGPEKPHVFYEDSYGGYYAENVMISA